MNRTFSIFALIITGILFSFSGCKDNDVTGVTISPSICVLQVDETKQLTAIVSPNNADDKSVKWVIHTLERIVNPLDTINVQDVASISENGKVKGVVEGFASVICITNNMFYEAKADIMVGYATAVDGMYSGSLSENEEIINTAFKISILRISEYEAQFNMPFLTEADSIKYCNVTVDYISEKMSFEGENTISIQGVMTPVKVSGIVALYGMGGFEILVGDETVTKYSFLGQKEPRVINY
jgi:hypothetical protein